MTISASKYFRDLCRLLGAVQSTARDGTPMTIDAAANHAVRLLLVAREKGRKVLLAGNGGSAAIAGHLHNDLCKAVGVRAVVFTEPATLTAYTNDEGYAAAYALQLQRWADEGDVLLAISSSGRSENMLRVAAAAREHGCAIVTLTGFAAANPLRRLGDLNFYVPAEQYGPVELAHAVLTHYLTDAAAALLAAGASSEDSHAIHDHQLVIKAAGAGDGRSRIRRRRASA